MSDETLSLSDQGADLEADYYFKEFEQEQLTKQVGQMMQRYEAAKRAKVGVTVTCPTCGVPHRKTTYHKIFCSNQKTTKRGVNSCKDRYWNLVNPRGKHEPTFDSEDRY